MVEKTSSVKINTMIGGIAVVLSIALITVPIPALIGLYVLYVIKKYS